jgi:hypothetical protein
VRRNVMNRSMAAVSRGMLEALDKVFARLREIFLAEGPRVEYFTVDLRVASDTPIPRPR